MLRWILIYLLLLSTLRFSFSSSDEGLSGHVHVVANDHMVVFARNRDGEFHLTLSPYETPAVVLHLNYTSLQTEAVRSLVLPDRALRLGLIEFVFIGEKIDSSEQFLFHVQLQRDEKSQNLSVVRLEHKSLAPLSRAGVECALGIHPRGTYVFVIGDRAGYVYDLNDSLLYDWSPWDEYRSKRYPKAISVTVDNYIIIGVYLQMVDTIYPTLYNAKFYSTDKIGPLKKLADGRYSEIPDRRTPASITLRGSLDGDDFAMAVGIPSIDTVLLYFSSKGFGLNATVHTSEESGVKFGQVVALAANNTYGVLSSGLATPPWSTGRVQVCFVLCTARITPTVFQFPSQFYPIPRGDVPRAINPAPLFVYPNNQQHYPYNRSANPTQFGIVSLFSWTDGFGIIVSQHNYPNALMLPASPPGHAPIHGPSLETFLESSITVLSPDRCTPGTYNSAWDTSPCHLCPPRTLNNGSSGIHCTSCDADDGASALCFRGATHRIDRQRLIDREQADPFPDSPDSTQFDDVLLNHVFQLGSTSDPRCLLVAPMFWGSIAIGLGAILFAGILFLGCFSKMMHSQLAIKAVFTHLDLIGEGQLWLGGLVTLAIIALVTLTCKFSISFSDLYPIENVTSDARESISCDSSLINAKFSSSLKLLSTRKHPEEKLIFDLLDEQSITLTVEFISTGFQCPSVSLKQNLARGQVQKIRDYNCSYDKNDDVLTVSSVLPQHLITIQFNLEGPFVVGGLRVCLSGPDTTASNGRYVVQSLDYCHFVYTPDEVLSVDAVTNIEMTKIINRTAANDVDAKTRETFSGIWLPMWTTDKSSLWDSHIYTSAENEYRRSLNWRLSLIVEMRQSKFYMNNIQEPIARGYEIVFKTVLFSSKLIRLRARERRSSIRRKWWIINIFLYRSAVSGPFWIAVSDHQSGVCAPVTAHWKEGQLLLFRRWSTVQEKKTRG